ncbi:hypothetical protein EDS67_03135 [candidate division KSB1 bacterium]|nr:MAG: hypothetical protein EDS67_03135 [candidate division KSB1 bacterium]MBC6951177.1 hypothetical protein [candidate division KSB1 bacterium]MCE7940879.1 hypothetical protein [Chlorobi bacterium CHB1]
MHLASRCIRIFSRGREKLYAEKHVSLIVHGINKQPLFELTRFEQIRLHHTYLWCESNRNKVLALKTKDEYIAHAP